MALRKFTFEIDTDAGNMQSWNVNRRLHFLSEKANRGYPPMIEYWMKVDTSSGYAKASVVGVEPNDNKKCGVVDSISVPSTYNGYRGSVTVNCTGMLSALVNEETFPNLKMLPVVDNFGHLLRFIITHK